MGAPNSRYGRCAFVAASRPIEPVSDPVADMPMSRPISCGPNSSQCRAYIGSMTIMTGKTNTVVSAMRPIMARVGLSDRTWAMPSFMPPRRRFSSSGDPRGRGWMLAIAAISARKEIALR